MCKRKEEVGQKKKKLFQTKRPIIESSILLFKQRKQKQGSGTKTRVINLNLDKHKTDIISRIFIFLGRGHPPLVNVAKTKGRAIPPTIQTFFFFSQNLITSRVTYIPDVTS